MKNFFSKRNIVTNYYNLKTNSTLSTKNILQFELLNITDYFLFSLDHFYEKKKQKFQTKLIERISTRSSTSTVINCLCRKGLKLKAFNSFNLSLVLIYNTFKYFNYSLNAQYQNYQTLFNLSLKTKFFYKFEFLSNFLLSFLTPMFDLKISKISSKIRKRRKSKEKIKFDFKYLYKWQRRRWFITQMLVFSWSFALRRLSSRLRSVLENTLLNWKDGELHKLKIKIYSFVLSKKKTELLS